MNIDYHALLPINGKKFRAGSLTAVVLNIPGPQQNSNNLLYFTRFEGAERRMLNLWVADETLQLNPNAHRDVFKAVDDWLKTDEGRSDAPHRFFDETQKALIPYVPGTGPVRGEVSGSSGDRLRALLDGLKPTDKAAVRLAWDIKDENTRIDSLIDLAQELSSSEAAVIYLELIETILKSPNVQYRRDKIGRLVPHLPVPLLSTLVDELKKENDEGDRNRLFEFVLQGLPLPQLQSLVSYAKTWGIQDARNLFLARIAENLADKGDVEQAFSIAETLTNVSLRDETVKNLFRYKKKADRAQRSATQPTAVSLSGDERNILGSSGPRPESSGQETMEIASRVLADTPDEELDLLDFGVYADALAALISDKNTKKPITIGIDAAWGMGKTQLMKMVRKKLTDPVSDQLQKKVKGRSRFPTVWFNAWKYDREDALWAALVLEILDQSTKRLPAWERRCVNVRLKFRRLNWRWVLGAALSLLPLALLVLFRIWLLARSNPALGYLLIALGILPAAGAYRSIKEVVRQIRTLQQDLSKYIKTPDYQEKIGFLAEFERDFGRVIDIVTENGKWPLVVFIDDLDRCGPAEAVEIVEAINILLDSRHCVFVIGMDAKAVAQSIQSKYKTLEQTYATDPAGLTLGEQFLEKILQINFRIPPSQEHQVQSLIQSQLEMSKEKRTAVTEGEERRKLTEQIIQAEQRGGEKLSKATEIAMDKIVGTGAGISKEEIQEVSKELSERAFEDDERVHQAVLEAAPYLDSNPRKIKKFINNFRLHALIAQKRGVLGRDGISVGLLAKAVVISMCWPDLAFSMSKDGIACQNLKDVFVAQELLRASESSESLDDEEIRTAQNALKSAIAKVSKNKTLERFIHATELNQLLTSMAEGEANSFLRCFQLSTSQKK